jgi:hypothetical protein
MNPTASALLIVIFVCCGLLAHWTARTFLAVIMLAMARRAEATASESYHD